MNTWKRVASLLILVAGSLVAVALGEKELASMLAGAAAGAVTLGGHDGSKPKEGT